MAIRCLIAGFNYPNTGMDLPDCVLDAERFRTQWRHYLPNSEIIFQTDRGKSEYLADIREFADSVGVGDVGYWFDSRHTSRRRGLEADGWEELIVTMPKAGEEGIYIADDEVGRIMARAGGPVFYVTDSCYSYGFNDRLQRRSAFFGGARAKFVQHIDEPDWEPGETREYASRIGDSWKGLLFSGCREGEYSYSTGSGGAFSIWREHWINQNPALTWRELQQAIVPDCLPTNEYPQTPKLQGPARLKGWPVFSSS